MQAALKADCLEELLENEETLADQLDALPYLCRFMYDASCAYICGLMDPLIQQFREAVQAPAPAEALSVIEGQLSWLVYIIGAVIKGRLTSSSAESQEVGGIVASLIAPLPISSKHGEFRCVVD